ncbi:ABC transporter ATP-binding protein [Phenylobacterium deserti]|uniref:ABC transporter ATP-binding protein n=1 Tax=Phenylobacterium deserti TaxID=1914756 RepID=A0A328AQB1_9CAUL|nr:ABC transporter ATP-binding protein [Phenylobacterium deserti]RAK57222.1 ABC transporter ATP-binding protein [Phenylobacterium deserti]
MDLPQYAIEAKGLTKTYPATKTSPAMQALKGIDLAIPRGSIFGLLGPNGAGKSTFINILSGLTRKTGGTVKIWDRDIDTNGRNARAAIGVVPQEIAADPFFTPKEALDVAAGMYAVPPNERRTDELLAALGLSDKAGAYVRQLSGGMKRRLMVAKAMVHNPPVLILDEPTAGVDVELRRQLWNYVLELNRQGVTIVLTTHYLEEAQELCDQIAIINRGQVVACEPTSTLLRRMDTRNVIVTPQEPMDHAPLLPGFETKLLKSGGFSVAYRTGESNVEQVLAAIRLAGLHIKDISTEDPDLEDIFVALTYRADEAAQV